ncbi:MAG: CRISPR-associated endonuclease Cas2 [Candidatus Hodarchaeaceae archaeon]|nr:CRISPR-associated endonuclease Cas2 [Candidatus Hodarchaeaceae archaeon]
MAYLLIYDLDGRSNGRRKINRYLNRNAQMVQHSVWRFQDLIALSYAAKQVRAAGGKVLAFSESDRILLTLREIRQFLQRIS